MLRATGLDHVVVVCSDVERTVEWYRSRLGVEPERLDEWRAGEAPFVSVRVDEGTIIDLVAGERTGENVAHICLTVAECDLHEAAESGDFDVIVPPRRLFGARGWGIGMYVRDPDGNVVEVRHYGGTT